MSTNEDISSTNVPFLSVGPTSLFLLYRRELKHVLDLLVPSNIARTFSKGGGNLDSKISPKIFLKVEWSGWILKVSVA